MNESIVVEIKDSVASSIPVKLREIATEARAAQTAVTGLQKNLGTLKLGSMSVEATRAATASAQLARAQDQAALASLRLAEAQQRATQRASEAQKQALANANAATTAAKAQANYAAQVNKGTMSQKQYNAAMRGVPAQITDIVVSLQGGQRPLTVLLQQGGQLKDMFGGIGPAFKALTAGLLAMISPLTITIGLLGTFAAIVGIVESRMREINGLVAQFAATGRGNITGSFIADLRKELQLLPGVSRNAATEIISAFANVRSVGGKQLEQATKLSVDLATALGTTVPKASKILAEALDDPKKGIQSLDKELGSFTVQQMKAVKGFMEQGKTAQAQQVILDSLAKSIKGLTDESLTPMQRASTNLGNAWNKFVGELENSGPIKTANEAITGLLIALTNILEKLNDLASWNPPEWMKTFGGAVKNAGSQIINPVGSLATDLFSSIGSKSGGRITGDNNIRGRTGPQFAQSTESKAKAAGLKGGGGNGSAESRAAALAKINAQLDNQIKLASMLGDAREKEEMFDRINEGLIGRRIKLHDAERKTIKEKIDAIVNGASVQQEANRIYEEATGPLRTFNAIQTAADDLLKRGAISGEEHGRQLTKAFETYSNLNAPMRQYNIDLDNQLALSRLNTEQLNTESQIQRIELDLLSNGNIVRKEELDALRARYVELQRNNEITAAENALLDQSIVKRQKTLDQISAISALRANPASGFTTGDAAGATTGMLSGMGIDTEGMQVQAEASAQIYKDMYAQIDAMRQQDLISERDAQTAKNQIAVKQTTEQLAGASAFFGELSKLQSSNVKEFARIGKAAAIAQAIMNTYQGATKALAQGGVYGAAMAAAVVATGMAQVASIRAQGPGFQSGGYTGNGGVGEVAGVVHGREFVVNAGGTSQYRPLLEHINNGGSIQSAPSMGGGGQTNLSVNVTNEIPEAQYEVRQITPGEVEVIARRVARKESDANGAKNFNNPNSKTFKAMQRKTTVERAF